MNEFLIYLKEEFNIDKEELLPEVFAPVRTLASTLKRRDLEQEVLKILKDYQAHNEFTREQALHYLARLFNHLMLNSR